MAHRRASIKKIRVDARRRAVNVARISALKSALKKVKVLLSSSDKTDIKKATAELYSKVDKATKKGIIPANRAARLKSRLGKRLSAK